MPLFAVPSVKSNSLGLLAGLCAFLIWGFLVVFWHMLDAVAPFEILCYRIVFSFVSLLPVVMLTRRWAEVVSAFRNRRVALTMFASSCVVGLNWFLYIWAISTGQILETSLGYYTNPLMNVLFGFLFLRERPSRLQGIAILLACIGVLLSFLGHNQFPWLALSLAFTFALYGFIRKTVSVEALPGLFIETIVLIPFSLGWILWLYWNGEGFLCSPTVREGFLLFLAGPVTSLPLVMFAYAARHMRLMTLGLLQYISPTCTFFLHIHVWGNLEPGCAGDVHFYLAGLAAVYGGKLAADAAFAALRERKKAGRHPSLFCTVERMGIWTEMVRLSWASCRKNSQCGNFHAYVYL